MTDLNHAEFAGDSPLYLLTCGLLHRIPAEKSLAWVSPAPAKFTLISRPRNTTWLRSVRLLRKEWSAGGF